MHACVESDSVVTVVAEEPLSFTWVPVVFHVFTSSMGVRNALRLSWVRPALSEGGVNESNHRMEKKLVLCSMSFEHGIFINFQRDYSYVFISMRHTL